MQINKMNAFRKNIFAIFFLIYIIIENGFGYIVEPGPQVIATKGKFNIIYFYILLGTMYIQ